MSVSWFFGCYYCYCATEGNTVRSRDGRISPTLELFYGRKNNAFLTGIILLQGTTSAINEVYYCFDPLS